MNCLLTTAIAFATRTLLILLTLALTFHVASAHEGHDRGKSSPAKQMSAAAKTFLGTLTDELKDKATFAFDDKERTNWHFIPKDRPGVSLKEMNLEQRKAAHTLLRSPLSAKGYLKATSVMSLELVLHNIEYGTSAEKHARDEERYWFTVYGKPGGENPWGWRVEGHHLSLNFTIAAGKMIVSTPNFFGANPAEVRTGPRAGLRVLAAEEDLARELLGSMSDAQRKQAVIAVEAPKDVITGPGQAIDIGKPIGLPAAQMSKRQQHLLWQLITEYADNLRGELAKREYIKFKANFDAIHFAWAGSDKRGEGHYYRIHAPAFIIEYDNTQNDANHIHTVWHSLSDDFGLDTLRLHYAETPHGE